MSKERQAASRPPGWCDSSRPEKTGSRLPLFILLLLSFIFLALLCARISVFSGEPSGWDYFYHERVLVLSQEQGKLLPYDNLSAGGRVHTYPPFYYSLILAGVNSTGISAEALLRLASPVFLFLASLALFIFLGRTPAAALGAILFATFPEVLLFSSSSGLPSVASLFPLAILLAILFMRKTFPLLPAILLAISVGALHPLSAQVLFGFTVLFFIFTRNPKTILLGVAGLAVPLIWVSIFPFTTPLWGANANFLSTLLTSFSPLHIAGVTLLAFSLPALLAFGGLALATVWFPLLPLRFALYLAFPLALAAAKTKSRLFAAAFAITLLAFAPLTLSSVSPIIQPADRAALVWIDENLSKPVVAGHTDFSSIFLLGHARTIIDGFSEGVPDALERQAAIKASYDSLNFSGLCTKYGAKYVFTDKAEERLGHFAAGKPLFDNSYSKVLKLACQGAS